MPRVAVPTELIDEYLLSEPQYDHFKTANDWYGYDARRFYDRDPKTNKFYSVGWRIELREHWSSEDSLVIYVPDDAL